MTTVPSSSHLPIIVLSHVLGLSFYVRAWSVAHTPEGKRYCIILGLNFNAPFVKYFQVFGMISKIFSNKPPKLVAHPPKTLVPKVQWVSDWIAGMVAPMTIVGAVSSMARHPSPVVKMMSLAIGLPTSMTRMVASIIKSLTSIVGVVAQVNRLLTLVVQPFRLMT